MPEGPALMPEGPALMPEERALNRVVVIGGGLAGVTAALDCAPGAQVTLLESRGRLGGAAYSFERGGLSVDNGQHVFLRCCTAYRALLARLGAEDCVETQARLSIPVLGPGGMTAWLQRDDLPAPLHLARTLLSMPLLSVRERVSAAVAMTALGRVDPDDPAADAQSFGAWLSAHGQSANAVEAIWELIAVPTLNLRAADASLAQAAHVFSEGLLNDRAAGDVGYATVPLGEIHDVRARAALSRAGVSVRLGSGVSGVDADPDGFTVAVSGRAAESFDAVILAVPPSRAQRLLPVAAGVDPELLDALGTSPIVNLHAVFDRPVLGVPFAATVRSPLGWIFDRTASSGLTRGQYLAVSLSAADTELAMPAAQLRDRFLSALADVLPDAARASLQSFFVTREHAATFRAAPGSRALRPRARTAIPGLTLAGNWTDTGWPATMEGAVRSGHAAATETLAWLERRSAREAATIWSA